MSEKKRFQVLEAMERAKPNVITQLGGYYPCLAEVAEAVEVLQVSHTGMGIVLTRIAEQLDLIDAAVLMQGSAIAYSQGRLDALEEVARNAARKRERLETELADLRERVAALERAVQEDHVQPPEGGLCQERDRALSLRTRVELLEHRTRMLIRQGGTIS